MKDEPEEVRNDKKCFSKFIITNDSQKDLIYNDSPDKVDTHWNQFDLRSIIKVPFSKYKIEADPVSENSVTGGDDQNENDDIQ